jgi:hypothetical protein
MSGKVLKTGTIKKLRLRFNSNEFIDVYWRFITKYTYDDKTGKVVRNEIPQIISFDVNVSQEYEFPNYRKIGEILNKIATKYKDNLKTKSTVVINLEGKKDAAQFLY